jgi:phospholipase A1/A2
VRLGLLASSLFVITSVARSSAADEAAPSSQVAAEREHTPTPSAVEDEPELDILTFHRSNYFIAGFSHETQVKFQFSFKYDLWPSTSRHTVYLAYSQKSLWDLYDTSQPFRESNYAPEVFYAHYHSDVHGQRNPGCGLFAEQVGFEHESNGEPAAASRGWNRIFVSVEAACSGDPVYGLLGLRLWYPFTDKENKTIAKTQGYGELTFGVGLDHDASHINALLTVALRKGSSKSLGKGSLTVDARWRPTYQRLLGKAWKFAPYLWSQLFVGYGETMGTFDSASTSARLGIGFTDRAR